MSFNEDTLELAIIEQFKEQDYTHLSGAEIRKESTEVLLVDDLKSYLHTRYAPNGLTSSEVECVIRMLKFTSGTLYEENKAVLKMISNGFIFNREDSRQKDLFIELIDFEQIGSNNIKIVNQLYIKGYELRIPDAIVYVNGLPLVVMEFKSTVKKEATIFDAYKQLTIRYRRDIPELFKYNAFIVITDGVNTKCGTLFTPYEYFYAWRKIENFDIPMDGIAALESMIRGLFRKNRLIDVVKNFVYFPDTSASETKILCRCPQYFAAKKLLENIKLHMKPDGDGKGGTYFGATGCGKSYTMLFLVRLLMKHPDLQSPTIVLITDRTDLDDQLSKLFVAASEFIGDKMVVSIDSRENLKSALQGRKSGGVYLTTIHKFTEELELLTDRNNVICISDEAHRSQLNLEEKITITKEGVKRSYGFAKYLHDSLPNATYVGFTGTPIDATIEVFGEVVDAYTMTESVKDEITVRLVYDGRAAKVTLEQDKLEDIEKYYNECERKGANEYQIEESKKAVAKLDVIIGDLGRLKRVADDFVAHYESRVSEGATVAGKAMFVCSNREIAYDLYKIIIELRPNWAVKEKSDSSIVLTEKEEKKLKPIEKICMVMTRSKDDERAFYKMLGTKEYRKELDKQFKQVASNFKIAIVVDMWLTGFDVPCLDTIYIDKPLQQHSLIQTISRVNRVYEGKVKGLVVDYIGIKHKMNDALAKYTNYKSEKFEEADQSVTIVKDQLEILNQMFHKFDSLLFFTGTPKAQLDCLKKAVEYVQLSEDLEIRFMAAVKRMKQAFNLCTTSERFSKRDKDLLHFYQAVRAILFKYTKGDAPDIAQMNAKVRQMIADALHADGVVELFNENSDIVKMEIDILSDEYMEKILNIKLPNTKIKLLQKLLSQAINEFHKINKIKSIEFSDRLKNIVEIYNERRRDEYYAREVLDDVTEQLAKLLEDLKLEKNTFEAMGINYEEKAFYDILKAVSKKFNFVYSDDKMIDLSKKIKSIVDDKSKYIDWATREDIKAELEVDLILLLAEYGYPPVIMDDVFKDVLEQAENFKKYNR